MPENPDLLSLVLTLRPLQGSLEGRALPKWWGRAAQALLLRLVSEKDEKLVAELHIENNLRPFTVSNLLGHFKAGLPDPELTYTLRLTALETWVAQILAGAASAGGGLAPGEQVELDYLPFRVEGVALDEVHHPWAGRDSYSALSSRRLLGGAPPRQVSFHLASPTSFRSEGRQVALPLPELFFGSLLERWNSFAPVAFPVELRRYAAECLHLTKFNLRSRAVPLKEGGHRFGAVGEATFSTLNYDGYWMSLVNALAGFAQYSGVGAGTAMGLGQCRLLITPASSASED